MKKTLIFGTGSTGQKIYHEIKEFKKVVGFLDNDKSRWGGGKIKLDGIPVLGNAEVLNSIEYDEIIIGSLTGLNTIRKQLLEAGVEEGKIKTNYIETQVNARINFLRDFAKINKEIAKKYAVAEGGVFQGDFAKEINFCFPDSDLYLFDTFEGFDKRDIDIEKKNGYSNEEEGHLSITSEEIVLSKLPFKEKAVIRKGYFPETVKGLENMKYFFVNLDFDLYHPILEGLRYFMPRLVCGGVVLIHDYFNPGYLGVEKAVEDYEKENNIILHKFPIGDHCSLGIMK